MMVLRDEEEQVHEAEGEDCNLNGVDQPLPNNDLVFSNAAEEIPEYRKQLLIAKDELANAADMYQQDYLDKVEQRVDLAKEARSKAVSCLVDVSKRIYNLAGCFQQLLDDQVDKLQEIENLTVTASASLEITSCYHLRNELHSRLPAANILSRQPRIGRPETMETSEFFKENVIWEKLNYNKYDRLGAGLGEFDGPDQDEAVYVEPNVPKSMSQQSLQSTGSSNKSFVTATSAQSPVPPNLNHNSLQARDSRLSASSADIRQPKSPALNRCGSTTSLTSLNSSKSETKSAGSGAPPRSSGAPPPSKPVATVKRSLSSLKLQPSRAAPAPPPAKQNSSRNRVYSVKNETGEGLEKPSIPAPRPPPTSDEDHYAIPPSHRMPTLNEERGTPTPTVHEEVIYDDVRAHGGAPPAAPPLPQYQTIAVAPPAPPPPDMDSDSEFDEDLDYDPNLEDNEDFYQEVNNIYDAPSLRPGSMTSSNTVMTSSNRMMTPPSSPPAPLEEEEDLYVDNDLLPPAPSDLPPPDDMPPFDDGMLPPPPPDIMPPPPPEDEELYADMYPVQEEDDNIYTDNVVDNNDMVNTHTVSVSKDSGFYTEDQEDEDPVIEKVRAIFPYAATASDELNLTPGDVISVHVKNPDGWYEGSLNGVRGLFPGNYVESAE
ncbi:hypothetical protein ACHWQZ_G009659 [Mnemiopsis leidyi]